MMDIALVDHGQTYHTDVWVLNSDVSYHICSRRECFTIYEQVDEGDIFIA